MRNLKSVKILQKSYSDIRTQFLSAKSLCGAKEIQEEIELKLNYYVDTWNKLC